jgi:uncharacterized tellurite resistance protein B-like protein
MDNKLGLLRQLYQMSKADNEIKPIEYNFLYEIALSMDVPFEKLEEMFDAEDEYSLPKIKDERIIQIYRLALMMKVDKIIAPEEITTIKSIGLQMGLRSEAIDMMLQKINEKGTLSYNELIKIFSIQEN